MDDRERQEFIARSQDPGYSPARLSDPSGVRHPAAEGGGGIGGRTRMIAWLVIGAMAAGAIAGVLARVLGF
jgi:hypothetical protein